MPTWRIVVVLLLVALRAPAQQPDPVFTPTPLSHGPLLFLKHPREIDGKRWDVLSVADPKASRTLTEPLRVREVFRSRANIVLRERLDASRHVVSHHGDGGGLWIVDFGKGKKDVVAQGADQECVGVFGERLVYRKGSVLFERPTGVEAPARVLTARPVKAIVSVGSRGIVYLDDGKERVLRYVDFEGASDASLTTIDAAVEIDHGLRAELSPNRRLVALSYLQKSGACILEVRDLVDKRTVHQAGDVPIDVDFGSSQTPALEFTWIDDAVLRIAETRMVGTGPERRVPGEEIWVDIEVATGKRIAEHRRGAVGLRHEKPKQSLELPLPKRRIGRFAFDSSKDWTLWFADREQPIVVVRNTSRGIYPPIAVALDGAYAAYARLGEAGYEVMLVDGSTCRETKVFDAWCYDLTFR